MIKVKIAWIFLLLIVLITACGEQEKKQKGRPKLKPKPKTVDTVDLLYQPIKIQEIEQELFIDSIELQFVHSEVTLENIVTEINKNREAIRHIIIGLDKLYYNRRFEEVAYAEMRKEDWLPSSFPCQRLINRRYFFGEVISRGVLIKNDLFEKERLLLQLYDERQFRRSTPEMEAKFKQINKSLEMLAKRASLTIQQTRQLLENPESQIPLKDWHIGNPDIYMGFKS